MFDKSVQQKKDKNLDTRKLLMMGRKNAGKTSIHSILFSDFTAYQTKSMPFTTNINESNVMFLGYKLRINDCGGQDDLMSHYVRDVPHQVFGDVQFLVYVFDIQFKTEEQDLQIYKEIVQSLLMYSEKAKIFILLHKLDLIAQNKRNDVFEEYKRKIQSVTPKEHLMEVFGTSIWNESLYYAWSIIIKHIIPDIKFFNTILSSMAKLIQCEEIIVVEKSSFLIIGSYAKDQGDSKNILKYERISTLVKNFKIGCSKKGKEIESIVIRNQDFTIVLEVFTKNTFILLIFYDKDLKPSLVSLNIKLVHNWFLNNKSEELANLKLIW